MKAFHVCKDCYDPTKEEFTVLVLDSLFDCELCGKPKSAAHKQYLHYPEKHQDLRHINIDDKITFDESYFWCPDCGQPSPHCTCDLTKLMQRSCNAETKKGDK